MHPAHLVTVQMDNGCSFLLIACSTSGGVVSSSANGAGGGSKVSSEDGSESAGCSVVFAVEFSMHYAPSNLTSGTYSRAHST